MNWETLLSWGDSITIGARSYLAYSEYAGGILGKSTQREWLTPIHASCGFTVNDLNRSLTPVIQDHKALQPSLLTILIGTNDVKSPTSPELFEIAYRQVLVKASLICRRNQILAIMIPNLQPGVMYPYQFTMNESVAKFNQIIERLAKEFGIRTLKLYLEEEDFFDGVHLNELGSDNVGWQIAEFILRDRGMTSRENHKAVGVPVRTEPAHPVPAPKTSNPIEPVTDK